MRESKYSGKYVVVGPPGCGKTTWLGAQLRAILEESTTALGRTHKNPAMVCSLTRTAAAEVKHKAGQIGLMMDENAIGTLHSHAFRAIGCPAVADGKKIAVFNTAHPGLALSGATVDVDEPEYAQRDGGGAGESPGDAMAEQYHLLRARCVARELWPPHVVHFAAQWEIFKRDYVCIDFTDMIEMALRDAPTAVDNPKVILADEAQDMSKLEFSLLQKWGAAAGATIIVGDPFQALFAWRGANVDIFNDSSDGHFKILSQSYRVPAAVHGAAIRWVKNLSDYRPIEYFPRNDEHGEPAAGNVHLCPASLREPDQWYKSAAANLAAGKSVMVMASCSYQLFPLVTYLRANGVPFCNPWRSHRGDWNPLGRRRGTSAADRLLALLRPSAAIHGEAARAWTLWELDAWARPLAARSNEAKDAVFNRGAKQRLADISADNPDAMMTSEILHATFAPGALAEIAAWWGGLEAKEKGAVGDAMRWWAGKLLPKERKTADFPIRVAFNGGVKSLIEIPKLYIGTVHSLKGSEADCAYVFPDISPAGENEWSGGGRKNNPASRDGIIRMFYVAMTRARESLYLCEPGGKRSIDFGGLLR